MKVILLEDVKKVGKKDEIVEVSQGYYNNCLYKQNLGVEADKTNLKKLKTRLNNAQQTYDLDKKNAEAVKVQIEKTEFKFQLKSGKGGVTFGSISHKQILKALKDAGFAVDKKMIKGDLIAHIGYDKVTVQLHKEVAAEMKILVEEK